MKRKGSLSSPDVLQQIMHRIEQGRFRPGDRLIPAMIARELGGSTIPVREALWQLVGRGILVEQRNKGFSIAPMTSATLRALYAAHAAIIEQAMACRPTLLVLPGRPRNRWLVFGAIARHSGNDAIAALQHHLAGRLALVRKHEDSHFKGENVQWTIAESLRGGSVADAREMIARFHKECERSSVSIWQMMTDR